ncbi:hypothetical protein ACIRG5_19195 [Lentzea sp. NPDC102401]|uniref:hypothetical protein n=1 Tax=Lentzea sp. NPDC102401 TaxID=3364128 RepID=UPI0037FEF4BA
MPRSRAGRRFGPLRDDGTARVKLALFLRDCLQGERTSPFHTTKTLREAASECGYSASVLSKALNGTVSPSRVLVAALTKTVGSTAVEARGIELWRLAALEDLGLHPKDLVLPSAPTVDEFATLLRGYLVDRPQELTPAAMARASRRASFGQRPLSVPTINRMLSGKVLPTFEALMSFVELAGIGSTVRDRLFAIQASLAEQRLNAPGRVVA